ncbi:hypothetical protein GGP89_001187 [Salinibacter ruber]|uniref:Uncharacterized protein n=1 Tax=Salinibacter ruber TaxID=146919 RepID=A0A9X2RAS9_9BACT|nr:hypothetical protein [Salinibacter ruber]MCS3857813.1 hypothetical protein [Salinibacter ruber]MCS3864639.1 hypothetical protein [Salinibacter ruber]
MDFDTRPYYLQRIAPLIAKRAFLVGLFVISYLIFFLPVRSWVASEVMKPILTEVDTQRSEQYSVDSFGRGISVQRINRAGRGAKMETPIGGFFVLAGMFLIAIYPRHPYWLYVAAYQLGLGTLMFGMLVIGVGWAEWGFTVFWFLDGEFYRGTSLALPFLLLRADGCALFGAVASGAGPSETKGSED